MARIIFYCNTPEEGKLVREQPAPFWRNGRNLGAFAFHIPHFALLPMDREKLRPALDACRLSRGDPYTSTVTV